MKKLMIVDANSILNRAFYAIKLLTNQQGEYTNAVYGFLNIMLKYAESEQPDGICAAFDMRAPTFRHEFYEKYQAQRKGMPDELASQLAPMKEILKAMHIPVLEMPGYEADDIIGTVSAACEKQGVGCCILTGDKDDLQLASEKTYVKLVRTVAGKTQDDDYDAAKVQEEYGLTPAQFIDLKAIMGDKSDNIPGVAGIGEKGALTLIHTFGSLEAIYEKIDDPAIKPKMREKLLADKQAAFDSRYLATIDRAVPMTFDLDNFAVRAYDKPKLLELFRSLDLNTFIARMGLEEEDKQEEPAIETIEIATQEAFDSLSLERAAYVIADGGLTLCAGGPVYRLSPEVAWQGFFENPKIEKIGYDVKNDILCLREKGIEPAGIAFDVMLAAYITDQSDVPLTLEKITAVYLERPVAVPAKAVWDLYETLTARLAEGGQKELYYQIELPLAHILADMQAYGVHVDQEMLLSLSAEYGEKIAVLEQEIYASAGEEFNINSTKQLGEVLFQKLQLPVYKKNKTGPSTDIETLERLYGMHDIIPLLIEYRQLTKLKSTYVDGLLPLVDENGRLHTNYNQAATQTGRLSSTEPNLQNIPIRQEQGRLLRKLFTAPAGKVLVDADYSQIELRVLAHMANDGEMIKAFLNGADIHTETAAHIFGVEPEEVTSQMRSSAKAVNFGIVYGIGDFSLSRNIGVSRSEAKRYIESYKQKYKGITKFMEDAVEAAKRDGYVETYFKRRRYIPEIAANNFVTRSFGERAAMNAPIQGTAADIIKIAMVRVSDRLQKEGCQARLTMQVHDELVLEVPVDELEKVEELLRYEMEHAVAFQLPLTVEVHSGASLYDTK